MWPNHWYFTADMSYTQRQSQYFDRSQDDHCLTMAEITTVQLWWKSPQLKTAKVSTEFIVLPSCTRPRGLLTCRLLQGALKKY